MDLRQLQHFVVLADESHFTRAARRVNIVQSALSSSIRSLEAELGTDLFERSTRRVKMTPAGRALYEKARTVLASAREAREAVAAVLGLKRRLLVIGAVQSLGAFVDLPGLLGAFHAAHPDIDIHLRQDSSTALVQKIADGDVDLALLPVFAAPDDIVVTKIACEALVVACAASHPLAGRGDVTLERLAREPFVDFQPDWGTRPLVDSAFRQAGIERRIAFEVGDLGTLLDLTSRGLGLALVPESAGAARAGSVGPGAIATATVQEPEICWELVVALARPRGLGQQRNPAASVFMDLLKRERAHP